MVSVASASAVDAGIPPTPAVQDGKPPRGPGKRKTKNPKRTPHTIVPPCGDPWPRPYEIADGLRIVAPYHFTYQTHVKERWKGRTLIDIYESEFRDRPIAYYRDAIEVGKISVNGTPIKPDYVLIDGDLITHTIHRHEPPVSSEPIRIIHEDDDMIVINKPSGMPVHPAGRYNFNCVLEIMKSERHANWLGHPCNRLDRLTSGIMFVGKNPVAAKKMSGQIAQRTVRKEYIARAVGLFPDGEVVCDQPILQISPKLGLNRVRANGKHARTVFKRLAYYPAQKTPSRGLGGSGVEASPLNPTLVAAGDGGEAKDDTGRPWLRKEGFSIVRCLPVTGRTHQIRVHLQHLGHPIENDPIYANQKVWGIDLGANDAEASQNTDEDIISRLDRMGKQDVATAVAYHDEMMDLFHKRKAEKLSGENCEVCDTPLYTDPGEHELSLYLHSLRYEDAGGEWKYVSPLPMWAMPPDGMQGPTQVGGLEELIEADEHAPAVEEEGVAKEGSAPVEDNVVSVQAKEPESKLSEFTTTAPEPEIAKSEA